LIEPGIEKLLKKADSRYTLVVLAAKRSRQITSYYSQLGEGIRDFVPPQIAGLDETAKPLSVALREIADEKFSFERPPEAETRVK
jgi:DNA-directed RNA polymerase subunit omega